MATRTRTRGETRDSGDTGNPQGGGRSRRDTSAFSWGSTGGMLGAAAAGAAIAVAMNLGRKAIVQGMSASAGDWDQALAAEHKAALALFDKLLATDETQTMKRTVLLMRLGHALDKHAHEEEHVVYPALREANEAHDADALEAEHGYVKTYLYELTKMKKDSPDWAVKLREFRNLVEGHARMEEQQVFPRLKSAMSDEQNRKLTALVNKAGFMMA